MYIYTVSVDDANYIKSILKKNIENKFFFPSDHMFSGRRITSLFRNVFCVIFFQLNYMRCNCLEMLYSDFEP